MCDICKDIKLEKDSKLTFMDLLELGENVDWYYEEIQGKKVKDNLRLVVKCRECGKEKRPE